MTDGHLNRSIGYISLWHWLLGPKFHVWNWQFLIHTMSFEGFLKGMHSCGKYSRTGDVPSNETCSCDYM